MTGIGKDFVSIDRCGNPKGQMIFYVEFVRLFFSSRERKSWWRNAAGENLSGSLYVDFGCENRVEHVAIESGRVSTRQPRVSIGFILASSRSQFAFNFHFSSEHVEQSVHPLEKSRAEKTASVNHDLQDFFDC